MGVATAFISNYIDRFCVDHKSDEGPDLLRKKRRSDTNICHGPLVNWRLLSDVVFLRDAKTY